MRRSSSTLATSAALALCTAAGAAQGSQLTATCEGLAAAPVLLSLQVEELRVERAPKRLRTSFRQNGQTGDAAPLVRLP
ncbi:hypothetical protein G6O69_12435 [Pseudenhygromyxa sp. WMMC2535]|uniref:hypothetical protein n=1 Tax=Pseudenhygromyxa sp. WMMC2535 TaxID=2712867 RepID=UPI00155716CA|nr:hypothetical protein [Pseudenhygromyxa sp. WMMC2535]NVB38640.1 hypothetical protein [Pseudenhygromyxa sp. WMMC2535]